MDLIGFCGWAKFAKIKKTDLWFILKAFGDAGLREPGMKQDPVFFCETKKEASIWDF